ARSDELVRESGTDSSGRPRRRSLALEHLRADHRAQQSGRARAGGTNRVPTRVDGVVQRRWDAFSERIVNSTRPKATSYLASSAERPIHLEDCAATARTGPGRATEAVIVGLDFTLFNRVGIDVPQK